MSNQSITEKLRAANIIDFEPNEVDLDSGYYVVYNELECFHTCRLTKEDLLQLANELTDISEVL